MQAVIQYGKIVSWLEMEYGLSDKESKASESFLLAAFLNLAMCYLKLREYTKAVECCDKVGGPVMCTWVVRTPPSVPGELLLPSGSVLYARHELGHPEDWARHGLFLSSILHIIFHRIDDSFHLWSYTGFEHHSRERTLGVPLFVLFCLFCLPCWGLCLVHTGQILYH